MTETTPHLYALDREKVHKTARDEYSMVWENSGKRSGDHDRALRHAIDAAVFGAEPMPEPGDLQQWKNEGAGLLELAYSTYPMAVSRLNPGGRGDYGAEARLVTRLRDSVEGEWGPWRAADKKTGQPLCECPDPQYHHDGPIALTDGRICGYCYGREGSTAAAARRRDLKEARWH